MTKLRWGILATGWIAEIFTQDLKLNDFQVMAVASRSKEKATAFAAQFDIARAYGSYAELASDEQIDAVYIATPHPQHLEPALMMITAGKHVLIEKAFTINQAQAEQIRDAAEAHGVVAMEAMWTRYLPHMVRIREILAAGTLGELRSLTVDHTQKLSDDPSHRINNLELGGGALLDLGIYPISFAWDLFGAPSTIQAVARLKETGADAEVAVQFSYPGGQIASTFSSSMARGSNEAVIHGTEASILIKPVWYNATSFQVITPELVVLETYESQVIGRGMQYQATALEQAAAAGLHSPEVLSLNESVALMGCLDEIRRQIGVTYPADMETT